jgi:hypothetical protein
MRLPEFTAQASLYPVNGKYAQFYLRPVPGPRREDRSVTTQATAAGFDFGGIVARESCDLNICHWDGLHCYCPTDTIPPRVASL